MLAAAVNFDAGAPRIKQPGRPFAQVAGIIESWKLFEGGYALQLAEMSGDFNADFQRGCCN